MARRWINAIYVFSCNHYRVSYAWIVAVLSGSGVGIVADEMLSNQTCHNNHLYVIDVLLF